MEVAAGGGGYSTVEYLALVTGPMNINIFNSQYYFILKAIIIKIN